MIIFYDWAKNGLDRQADYTAIVWKAENGYVYQRDLVISICPISYVITRTDIWIPNSE